MQSAAIGYKLIKKIRDDRFDEENIHQYELLIQFGVRDLQIGVIDCNDNRVIYFEDYVLGDLNSHQELLELFKVLFESHAILQAGFWKKVKVSLKNNKYAQVPEALFLPEAISEYLKFNAPIDTDKEKVIFCSNPQAKAVTVFAVQKELFGWLSHIYCNTNLIWSHQSAALIEGTLSFASHSNSDRLYIYVDRFKLHIISVAEGRLRYYNQFAIKQFSDYVKYIMLVLRGLGMEQQSSEIILWGYIGKSTPHYQEFVKYIRNISFGNRPASLKFGYIFDEIQEHHFFDLFSIDLINDQKVI